MTGPAESGAIRGGPAVAVGAGLVIGAAAGLIGVGGGEFRIPLLLYLLRGDVRAAAGINLVVGLFTVTLSFIRRVGQTPPPTADLELGVAFAVASVAGAVLGARFAERLATRRLLRVVIGYLFVVGVWMLAEALLGFESGGISPGGAARFGLALLLGFLIASVSAALGVAGGEMRIPALMFLFGYGIKMAGTLSLLASIPTVAAGAVTYRRLGRLSNPALMVAVLMGVGSLGGVLLGTAALPHLDAHTLKAILGAILLAATVLLARWRPPAAE